MSGSPANMQMSAPIAVAYFIARIASDIFPFPSEPPFSAYIIFKSMLEAIPAIPISLFATAPIIPAICVP